MRLRAAPLPPAAAVGCALLQLDFHHILVPSPLPLHMQAAAPQAGPAALSQLLAWRSATLGSEQLGKRNDSVAQRKRVGAPCCCSCEPP